jgi:dUTP pyrophosphatase
VIDSDYRGEVIVGLFNMGCFPEIIEKNSRIAQIIFMPHYTGVFEIIAPEQASETERGAAGFGSTGR